MWREILVSYRRVLGETHIDTIEAQWQLAQVLAQQNEPKKIDEARGIRDAALPVARRVLGPQHELTRKFGDPGFLVPPADGRPRVLL